MSLKDIIKKINRSPNEAEDLDSGYDNEYYQGAYGNRPADDRRPSETPAEDRFGEERRLADDRFATRFDAPVVGASSDDYYAPRRGWQEEDAPGYRERPVETVNTAVEPAAVPAEPEYLTFSPATYRDCREAIVRGLAAGHVIEVRLGRLEANDVLRLFDYMMGAVLALEGELVRPRTTTVVLLPAGVELDESKLEPEDEEDDEMYEDEDEYEDEYENEYEDEDEYEDEYEDDDEYEDEYDDESEEDESDDVYEKDEYAEEDDDGVYADEEEADRDAE